MEIINNLNSIFRICASELAATNNEIQNLLDFSEIDIPDDYLALIKSMTEIEISINEKTYIRIWGPNGCIEMNQAYEIQTYIPKSLAIGDDESGSALILMDGNNGFGLYKVGFGDIDISGAEYIANSLRQLLIEGIGYNIFL